MSTISTNLMFDGQRKCQQSPSSSSVVSQQNADEARIALIHQLTGGGLNNLSLLNAQQQRNLTFTTQDAAQRSVMEVLARHNTTTDGPNDDSEDPSEKRKHEDDTSDPKPKKQRTSSEALASESIQNDDDSGPAPVAASEEGMAYFNDNDVLSGRGGGTNVHPGNRHFRDLINLHRRAYLKARKNDKPSISRAIVRGIRENNGAFLRRDEKSGLWYEIGDDAAREKTSQALRQRAPEMRKILFESEREQARQEGEEQLRQQQQLLASGLGAGAGDLSGFNLQGMPHQGFNPMQQLSQQGSNPMLNPLFAMQMQKQALGGQMGNLPHDPYSQMSQNLMTAALLGGGINRFATNGAWTKPTITTNSSWYVSNVSTGERRIHCTIH